MNLMAMYLESNQYWYGFFLGFMAVIGTALVIVLAIRARQIRKR